MSLGSALVALLYFTAKWTIARLEYNRLMKQHGCSPVPHYPHKDPIFGSDFHRLCVSGKRDGNQGKNWKRLFRELGKTFEVTIWGEKVLYTADTENIQAINTTFFENFGVEPIRLLVNRNWISSGIFTSDWKHSRKFVMPSFNKALATDLSTFSVHLDRMMNHLPQADGEMVDLQPLFRRMVSRALMSTLVPSLPGDGTLGLT